MDPSQDAARNTPATTRQKGIVSWETFTAPQSSQLGERELKAKLLEPNEHFGSLLDVLKGVQELFKGERSRTFVDLTTTLPSIVPQLKEILPSKAQDFAQPLDESKVKNGFLERQLWRFKKHSEEKQAQRAVLETLSAGINTLRVLGLISLTERATALSPMSFPGTIVSPVAAISRCYSITDSGARMLQLLENTEEKLGAR